MSAENPHSGEVVIAGIGQIPVGEHWSLSLRQLAHRAMRAAIADAGGQIRPQALYIGNFLASTVSHQSNLGALLVGNSGLDGIEAFTVEAAGASGAGAFRVGYMAVASGFVDAALVLGVEKMTDMVGPGVETRAALSQDYDYESMTGMTPAGQAGLLMRRYLHETGAPRAALSALPLLAHANGAGNPHAMYRKAISQETYDRAELVSDPLNLMDVGPHADGAAAALLVRSDRLPNDYAHPKVRVTGSSDVIDALSLHDRADLLAFEAAALSVQRACRQAGILPQDADLFELSDAFSIYALLSLEAAGLAPRGEAWRLARAGRFNRDGDLPILTMGGCKARGNPIAAVGMYQIVEAAQQLRGDAGRNQVEGARRALTLALGGPASTAVAHVLERWE